MSSVHSQRLSLDGHYSTSAGRSFVSCARPFIRWTVCQSAIVLPSVRPGDLTDVLVRHRFSRALIIPANIGCFSLRRIADRLNCRYSTERSPVLVIGHAEAGDISRRMADNDLECRSTWEMKFRQQPVEDYCNDRHAPTGSDRPSSFFERPSCRMLAFFRRR
jgi:hypothetical protein